MKQNRPCLEQCLKKLTKTLESYVVRCLSSRAWIWGMGLFLLLILSPATTIGKYLSDQLWPLSFVLHRLDLLHQPNNPTLICLVTLTTNTFHFREQVVQGLAQQVGELSYHVYVCFCEWVSEWASERGSGWACPMIIIFLYPIQVYWFVSTACLILLW